MRSHREKEPLLLWQFIKFSGVFLGCYYVIIMCGSFLLRLDLVASFSRLGAAGAQLLIAYTVGIQFFGLALGSLGYGTAAVYREQPAPVGILTIRAFLSRGPFQRTGVPSWQGAFVLFSAFFYLGYVTSAAWFTVAHDINPAAWKEWTVSFRSGYAFGLFMSAPAVASFVASRCLLPEMTAAEFWGGR